MKLLLLLIFFSIPAQASLTVFTENLPGFQHLDGSGKLVGATAKKTLAALDLSGIDYNLSINDWPMSYSGVLRTKDSCIFSLVKMPARENKFLWIAQLDDFRANFYSFKSHQLSLDSIEQAKRFRIAVLKQNYGHEYLLDKGFSEANNLILMNSFDNIFEILKNRQDSVDLVVLSERQYNFEREKDRTLDMLEPILAVEDQHPGLYFACNKDTNPALVERLQTAFNKVTK